MTSFDPIQNLGNDFDDQASRLKKKKTKLSKSIAYKVEMAMFNSKMNPQSISVENDDQKENLENESDESKKDEPIMESGQSGPSVEDRTSEPIESNAS